MVAKYKKIIFLLVIVLVFWGGYRGIFYLTHRPVESTKNSEMVDITQEPEQVMLDESRILYERPDGFRALAIAEYKIQGIVLGKSVNQKYGGSSIYPVDIGLIWGEPAISNFDSYLDRYYSRAVTSTNRTIWIDFQKDPPNGWSRDYVMSHISNNHIFPANKNIYNAIIRLKQGKKVIMKGFLLRTDWRGKNAKDSSLSRADSDCEDFYVEKLQVGDKVYE
jgi:hypothetical protein